MKKCIDLYSGIGGWTLGMKISGIQHKKSYEWNKYSNLTHNINFETNTGEINIRELDFTIDLPEPGTVDFVVGSPPCTQFSYANKGGNGNIEDGLVDMYQFLRVVDYLKPKYWAMENVPRVKGILEKVLEDDKKFKKFKKLFNYIEVVDISDYGLPQKRKRMIAGNFPFELFESYKKKIGTSTLGDVLNAFRNNEIIDPIYGYSINRSELSDHLIEDPLNIEELRINRESKKYHPVYNNMSFPEDVNKPSRTVTSTCTRVSRESLVIKDKDHYRRLTIRERAMLMGFPITYQFYGNTYSEKLKMIGNAIPPVATYYLFQSMLEVPLNKLTLINNNSYIHKKPKQESPYTLPSAAKFKYRVDRSFRFAIPEYRFGSGVRFDLANKYGKNNEWKIKFHYGSSKHILVIDISEQKFSDILLLIKRNNINLDNEQGDIEKVLSGIDSNYLQSRWNHTVQEGVHPYEILDEISVLGLNIKDKILNIDVSDEEFIELVGSNLNKKLFDNKALVLSGLILAYIFNNNINHGN